MATPMTPAAFFAGDSNSDTITTAPASAASSLNFQMALEVNRGRSPFVDPSNKSKRPRRSVRKVQTRVRGRAIVLRTKSAPEFQQVPEIVVSAADTDTKLDSLSDEVKAIQDKARVDVFENFSQKVDNESLKLLEEANEANNDFNTRLDNLSKAVIKTATEPMEEPELNGDDLEGETIADSDSDQEDKYCNCLRCRLRYDQPIFFTLNRAPRSEDGTESYCIVDSTPSLNSDDVFGAAIPRSMPTPQMQLVMPVLNLDPTSSENTESSGRSLAPIDDESTLSSSSLTPPVNTPSESASSMAASMVQPNTLAARLEEVKEKEVEKKKSKQARSKAWLEDVTAREIAKDAKNPPTDDWLDDQIAAAMAEEVEAIDDDDEFFDDDEDWVVINEEDVEDMEDWFEVVTETMVKSTD